MSALRKSEIVQSNDVYRAMITAQKITVMLDEVDPFIGFIAPVRMVEGTLWVGILDKSLSYDAIFLGYHPKFTIEPYEGRMKVLVETFHRDKQDPAIFWAKFEMRDLEPSLA